MDLISVDSARERILTHFQPVGTESLHLTDCFRRVLASDIMANHDLPSFDNASMDGFAVHAADLAGASPTSPRSLEVIADMPAGTSPEVPIAPGQAARIMTGAPMPVGADAVIPVEDTDFYERKPGAPAPKRILVYRVVGPGAYIRVQGMDIRSGQPVLSAGHRLRSQDLGLLALLGVAKVKVFRRPRVSLLSSGDELIPVDEPLRPGKIHDSNTYTLSALIEEAGAQVVMLGIAADNRQSIQELLDEAVHQEVDLILSSAGVSVGSFDFIKDVVESQGDLDFWRVNIRPGKPLVAGSYLGIPFIGLPGNPVSAFVSFEVFVRPALDRLSGRKTGARPRVSVRLAEDIDSDGRESYLRALVYDEDGNLTAKLAGHQGSGNLMSVVEANALLIVPAGVKSLAAGMQVDAWLL